MSQLGINVTDGLESQYYEVFDEMTLEDLKCIAFADFGKDGDEVVNVTLIREQQPLDGDNASLKVLGLKSGDMLLYRRKRLEARRAQAPAAAPSTSAAIPVVDPTAQARMAELIKSMTIPKNLKPKPKAPAQDPFTVQARQMYEKMSQPQFQARFNEMRPELVEHYKANPQDWEGFLKLFKAWFEDEARKQALMNDPNSEEGQRLLAEKIRQQNIDHQYGLAMEHTPEAYVPIHMLYIHMTINGHPVKAFVDSGAQVSVMSMECAKRCDLEHLLDRRWTGVVHGVGGKQNFVGKIHMCKVQVEDHIFPCNFDVLGDQNIDLLLGLNILRRHQCSIDLRTNQLIFGDGTATRFLTETEIETFKLDAHNDLAIEPSPTMVAEMLGMGIDEAVAKEALVSTGNNLEAAIEKAIAAQTKEEPMDQK
ncbi:unnamed protein product, partial [Mesorhabditis spiculigera]